MNRETFAQCLQFYQGWSRTLTSMAWDQWRLLTSPCQASIGVLDDMLAALGGKGAASEGGARSAESGSKAPDEPAASQVPASAPPPSASRTPPAGAPCSGEVLEQVALNRLRKGLAPPREVYQAQNLDRINWSLFPEWARPSDPDLFGECPHEG